MGWFWFVLVVLLVSLLAWFATRGVRRRGQFGGKGTLSAPPTTGHGQPPGANNPGAGAGGI